MKTCPVCHSERIHQSRRKGVLEKIVLAVMFVRPFRCERCDARFFRWSISENPNAARSATAY
jgi:predicted Zn-ribbon and HTH transcriptional regulator